MVLQEIDMRTRIDGAITDPEVGIVAEGKVVNSIIVTKGSEQIVITKTNHPINACRKEKRISLAGISR